MDDTRAQGGDLVLAPFEQACVREGSTGEIQVLVGPHKESVGELDKFVIFDPKTKRFVTVSSKEDAKQSWASATQGQYVTLYNPVKDTPDKHPIKGKAAGQGVVLDVGRSINIPGPISFPLWPGQYAKVIDSHALRTNEYLLVRVIDGEVATENWREREIKVQTVPVVSESEQEIVSDATTAADSQSDGQTDAGDQAGEESQDGKKEEAIDVVPAIPVIAPVTTPKEVTLVTGQLLIIRGDVEQFFIPPTGFEVVPDPDTGEFVRQAQTLEDLEYCILVGEDGTRVYNVGPSIVFPEPTQIFFRNDEGETVFRAFELRENWGIHIRVVKDYEEDDGIDRKKGDQIFLTGKDTPIYMPRAEHSIVKYGKELIHYGVAIPAGKACYVLNHITGEVKTVKGECILLPNPIEEVIVERVPSEELISLLFPEDEATRERYETRRDALQHDDNSRLESLGGGFESQRFAATRGTDRITGSESTESLASLEFTRRTKFTKPRTINLDEGFIGAIAFRVSTNWAVKINDSTGGSRVVVGPDTVILNHDETPEIFRLSTGRPKKDDHLLRDVFLRVRANKVSDLIIDAQTSDLVTVEIPVSYRVHFEDDENIWFDVENYVKFLTDHLRSVITNVARQHTIEEFYSQYIDILRDAILGVQDEVTRQRPGKVFEENGMRVYDIEFGALVIDDDEVAEQLEKSQHKAIQRTLRVGNARLELQALREEQGIEQEEARVLSETEILKMDIEETELDRTTLLEKAKIESQGKVDSIATEAEADLEVEQETAYQILADLKTEHANERATTEAQQQLALNRIKSDGATSIEKAELAARLENQNTLDTVSERVLDRTRNSLELETSTLKSQEEIATDAFTKRMNAVLPEICKAIDEQNSQKLAELLAANLPQWADGKNSLIDFGTVRNVNDLISLVGENSEAGKLISKFAGLVEETKEE